MRLNPALVDARINWPALERVRVEEPPRTLWTVSRETMIKFLWVRIHSGFSGSSFWPALANIARSCRCSASLLKKACAVEILQSAANTQSWLRGGRGRSCRPAHLTHPPRLPPLLHQLDLEQ